MTTFSFQETPESRAQDYSNQDDTITRIYTASGEQDDGVVRNYAYSGSPESVTGLTGTLYRKSISLRPEGFQLYTVEVAYGRLNASSISRGSYTFSFETTGASKNVKVGWAHIKSYPTASYPGDNNPHKGAIGVLDDKVEGVDILIPTLRMNFAFKLPQGVVTIPYAKGLSRATGTYNKYRFLAFDPGELLFIGANGEDGTNTDMTVNFGFEASENVTGLSSGGITGIDKLGWEHLWHEFNDVTFDGKPAVNAFAAHVEQVYLPSDFDAALKWGIYTRG